MQVLIDSGSIIYVQSVAESNISMMTDFANSYGLMAFAILVGMFAIIGIVKAIIQAPFDLISNIFNTDD